MEIFAIATKLKLTFSSCKGDLDVIQLWDVPLKDTSKTREVKFDLDTIARSINSKIKACTEDSFVEEKVSSEVSELEIKLEVVKYIIADKISIKKAVAQEAEKRQKKQKILSVLSEKKDQQLHNLSVEELEKALEEL